MLFANCSMFGLVVLVALVAVTHAQHTLTLLGASARVEHAPAVADVASLATLGARRTAQAVDSDEWAGVQLDAWRVPRCAVTLLAHTRT